ncbi:gamma-glutamyltransferase [Myroides sp. 1354]|uniref:gamma-glutamyltransferase n=1 Tax=unclassified Myroides TaxID=2642485 RepID=UPI00257709C2|nr:MULTISPECIES: gamma-glutamyltransferase [unclassified Myroides]MDM1044779.1 gamma-glutamyltransferase [Myroides sp. R163-1]MDM1055492.1 gamma-glutamyltransferase [Myroides sp. 1354]MDM1068789.1 gamma-glutamyltransferase [Myroides sp. 1372]
MKKIGIVVFLLFGFFGAGIAQNPVTYRNGMVVSAHPESSQVGVDILKKGGNAIDAAVAVELALAVVYPNAGNIGGGGFMIYRSADGKTDALDYREKAPSQARENMYWAGDGTPIAALSMKGGLASGVPGTIAGMVKAHEKYGSLPWREVVQPAIDLAEKGFRLTEKQAKEFTKYHDVFVQYSTQQTALTSQVTWNKGDLFVQSDLAQTLKRIQQEGRKGFYEGEVAKLIVEEMKRGNGMITLADLKQYEAVWRTPIVSEYKGLKVISMPPPSSGGIALIALLQSVERFPLKQWGFQSEKTIQVMVEAERRVYADRAKHLGDPDFWKVPQEELTNKAYNVGRMSDLNFKEATPSSQIKAGVFEGYESEETTHYAIVDQKGNAVSATTTLNDSYGSKVIVGGAGFLLNNEMDDFSVKPGTPNMYGLVGGKANAIEGNKRMLSSMTPTILEKNGKLYMVVGTPGGSTIITSVFQTILNVVEFGMNMQEAVAAPRFHHQWLPDQIDYEPKAIEVKTRKALEDKKYVLKERNPYGKVEGILVNDDGSYQGGADPRGDDIAKGY